MNKMIWPLCFLSVLIYARNPFEYGKVHTKQIIAEGYVGKYNICLLKQGSLKVRKDKKSPSTYKAEGLGG